MEFGAIVALLTLTTVNTGFLLAIKYEMGGFSTKIESHETRISQLEGAFIQQLKEA